MKRFTILLIALIGCNLRVPNPVQNSSNIGEGEYIEAGGNITVAFSILSYRALERYDSTLFDMDSLNANAIAIAWIRDTLQNPISNASAILYVDSLIPINMIYVDSTNSYVAPIAKFFGSFYIIDARTPDGGYIRAKVWAPTVGIDSIRVGSQVVESGDTVDGISEGDAIIFALFPPDDRPIIMEENENPLYSPFIVLISRPVDMEHGRYLKVQRGFTSRRDTIVIDSSRMRMLFPYENRLYELIVLTANIDTTTSIPPLDVLDIPPRYRRLLETMNSSGVLTISDIYMFYVQQ